MEKINIANLLKDCPKGMELDCTIFENATFEEIRTCCSYPIKIITGACAEFLTEYGCISYKDNAKCVIFPKGKTTWKGFVPPYEFKDGDIAVSDRGGIHLLRTKDSSYCAYRDYWKGLNKFDNTITTDVKIVRLATKEEKQKLFDAIKENGYKWNDETKTLEKLIKPKFKVGDKITNDKISITIGYIDDNYYYEIGKNTTTRISIKEQDNWKLDKFDITTLKPFDKVLVRHGYNVWHIQFFEQYDKRSNYPFVCINNNCYKQCIPYENNKHLFNTTNDCDEYYKTWE